ncbi:hypothetical protein KPL42_02990 [Clostridium gasigenes]|uniref:hypothetical protein n=1 Tax=Clostridium gasigenes TaxID=94869 RepID=UPI001C0B2363|nr:hypothetical protein [Clostridium gasigenes]MBU3087453.1 hypothetical protein [Clostridium gasigenes]
MASKLSISFRRSKKEQKIFNYFNNLEDMSIEVKIILSEWYEKNVDIKEKAEKEKVKLDKDVNLDTDITNF